MAAAGGSKRSLATRLGAKVGPLPVWAWALLLLIGGYLVYRFTGAGKSTPAAAPPDTSTATDAGVNDGQTTPVPAASGDNFDNGGGGGTAAANVNDQLLSQLSGFQDSIDALTATVQSSEAFWPGSGDAGSGSTTSNGGQPAIPKAAPAARTRTPARPTAKPHAPAHVSYYSYKPGQAPKGRKNQEAPAHGPAGTRLRFARGKGYYYA